MVRLTLPRYDALPYPRAKRPVWDALHGNARPSHWARRAEATRQVITDVTWLAKAAGLHEHAGAIEHITVQLVWAPGDRRRADADNLWPLLKACCDALARGRKDLPGLQLVPDDTPRWMTKHAPRIDPPPANGLWLDVELALAERQEPPP